MFLLHKLAGDEHRCTYRHSSPSLKGHSLERTPLYKGNTFLAASTVNACGALSHQRTPL